MKFTVTATNEFTSITMDVNVEQKSIAAKREADNKRLADWFGEMLARILANSGKEFMPNSEETPASSPAGE